jgi:aldehyde:ferredoxin oxidoreductase
MLPLFALSDEVAGGLGVGAVLGGVATLLGVVLTGGRKQASLTAAQWQKYGESMAKKYEDCLIAHTASDAAQHAKLIEQAEEIGRLTAEVAALKERLK